MAHGNAENATLQDSLRLVISTSGPGPPNPGKCIIFQKDSNKLQSLQGGEAGRKRVREVAELNLLIPTCCYRDDSSNYDNAC